MKYRSTFFRPVASSPLPTRTILYNPLMMNSLRDIASKAGLPEQSSDTELLEMLIFSPAENGNKKLDTELFHPFWKCSAPGSGRHLSFPPFQMKGVGKSLTMNYEEYGDSAGTMELSQALRSFIVSCLLDSTLVTGSALPVSVQQVKELKHLGIYSRILDCPRLASIGPDIKADEKKEIIGHLLKQFPGSDFPGIQKQIIASYAALAFLSGMTNATADNLLMDGKCIDEESLYWPLKFGDAILHFEIFSDTGNIRTSSFSDFKNAISHILIAFGFLLEEKEVITLDEAKETFYAHLYALSGDRSLLETWKNENSYKELEEAGWCMGKKRIIGNISSFTLTRKLHLQKKLENDFHARPRISLETQVQKFLDLTRDESVLFNPSQFSNSLFSWIGQSGFLLPVRSDKHGSPIANIMTPQEFWKFTLDKWPMLSCQPVELVAWNGRTAITLGILETYPEDVIPLYLKSGMHFVHAFKTVIKGHQNGDDKN